MTSVGTAFRGKRLLTTAYRQSTAFQHRGENGILREQQLMFMQLQGDVAIAQVICRLQQLKRMRTLHRSNASVAAVTSTTVEPD